MYVVHYPVSQVVNWSISVRLGAGVCVCVWGGGVMGAWVSER